MTGVNVNGQWLTYSTAAGGPDLANWKRQWRLAQASPRGGYIVQQVTRTISETKPDGSPVTPSFIKYWEAWRVPAGSQVTVPAIDDFTNTAPAGSTGSDTVFATARFYEGLILPLSFAAGRSPYAASPLSSTTDPSLSTNKATLPVSVSATLHF